MKNQAILIIAHGNFSHLFRFIQTFGKGFALYIHVDRRHKFTQTEITQLETAPTVKRVYSRYKINWAGFNMLKAILYLLKKAMEDTENAHFHLFSGQDYPIKLTQNFRAFMDAHQGIQFLEYHTLPYIGWDYGRYDRYQYFYLHDLFNFKTEKGRFAIRKLIRFQQRFHLLRQIPYHFETIYGGSCWFSLSRDCIGYILDYTKRNPSFYRRLRYTFAPEETYFHSIVMNSPFKNRVVNTNLRFIEWIYRNDNYPANLDETDFPRFISSNAFFARKFAEPYSNRLLEMIDTKILHIKNKR